jgi:hypothetical protein
METERVHARGFSQRLSALYANYTDAWRALFGTPGTIGAPTPTEEREQRWEGEGGRSDKP